MILYLILGFIIATIGFTLLNGLSDILSVLVELIKAIISLKIVQCNVAINKLNNSIEKNTTRVIGFNTTFEEEEEENE